MNYTFNEIEVASIGSIKEAWLKLNEEHQEHSNHFKEFYAKRSFEMRILKFKRLSEEDLHIEIVKHSVYGVIGYCIVTFVKEQGEVDSLYVDERFRDKGIGTTLMVHALQWLKDREIEDIVLQVAEGNEHVLKFYERFNFYPRRMMLAYKSPKD